MATACLTDVAATYAVRLFISSNNWSERGHKLATANHQYQIIDREAWANAIGKMEAARFAFFRIAGIGIGTAGFLGAMAFKSPVGMYGFGTLALAETAACAADLAAAGGDGVRELIGSVISIETEDN
jgi:hypothetical protein